jgi:YHS domain-containing protein
MGLFRKIFGNEKIPSSEMVRSSSASNAAIVKDPVCGMEIEASKAAGKSEYQGQTYYFCAPGCKQEFNNNPAGHASRQKPGEHSHGCSCCS